MQTNFHVFIFCGSSWPWKFLSQRFLRWRYTMYCTCTSFGKIELQCEELPIHINTDSKHMWPAGYNTSQTYWAQLNRTKTKGKSFCKLHFKEEWTWKKVQKQGMKLVWASPPPEGGFRPCKIFCMFQKATTQSLHAQPCVHSPSAFIASCVQDGCRTPATSSSQKAWI